MSRPRRHALEVRVVPVADPDPRATMDLVLDLLADAIADLAIAEARAEIAARLGVSAASIDREAGDLDPEARAELDRIAHGGAA